MKAFPFITLLLGMLTMQAQDLKIISYNIRLEIDSDGPNHWNNRREFLARQVAFYHPDFMGIQEGKIRQLTYLDSLLTDYDYIGRGRDDSPGQGEYSAIFYDKTRFRLISDATFWLSDTPDKVSKGWDAMFERVCTYGLFEDKKTRRRLYVFNTHLDHVGQTARRKGAELIWQTIEKVNAQGFPVILTGDFNSEPDSEVYRFLSSRMDDARRTSQQPPFGPSGTFNAFEFHKPVTTLIDYIFTSRHNVTVRKYAVLSDSKDCRYPSDHLPVYAEVTLAN